MLSGKKVMRVEMEVIKEARPVKQHLCQAFKQKFTEGGGKQENKERKIEEKETGGRERYYAKIIQGSFFCTPCSPIRA